MNPDYRPRFSFEVTEEQKQRADRLFSIYGMRKAVFGVILDDLLDLVEDYGGIVLGMIMSCKVRPREVIPSMKQAEEVSNGRSK